MSGFLRCLLRSLRGLCAREQSAGVKDKPIRNSSRRARRLCTLMGCNIAAINDQAFCVWGFGAAVVRPNQCRLQLTARNCSPCEQRLRGFLTP